MQENYRAWNIDYDEFSPQKSDKDRLRFLIRFAVLAPSSHNSQPWIFEVGDKEITISPDMRRALPASDFNNRQLYISLGCAIENLLIAADYYGFATNVIYGTDSVRIILQGVKQEPSQDKNHLIFAVPRRHTNRNPYDERMPDQQFITWTRRLATDEIRIDYITDESTKNKIADTVIAAGIVAMDDREFREELSRYVKSNITKERIGMPAFGMGVPTPISFIAPTLLRYLNMNKATKNKDEKLLKEHTPMMALISTGEDSSISWIQAGQVYERIALAAEQKNIKIHPMAAAIQIGEFYKYLQQILKTPFRPQVFFRMGYTAKSTPHSPRLSADEVTV